MSLILVFLLLLILMFGFLVYFLRPTSMEKAVEQQLANIGEEAPSDSPRISILKETAVRPNAIDEFAQLLPWSHSGTLLIQQAGQTWSLGSVTLASLAAGVAGYWIASLFNVPVLIAIAIAIALALGPYIYLYIRREIRFRQFSNLLPEAVDLMSRGLRAGHSISAVLEMVGNEIAEPVGSEFRALQGEQSLGLPLRESMRNLVARVPVDDMRFLATAILLQKESGGNLAQILDKTANVIRERARLRGQLAIYTAQGRIKIGRAHV